METQEQINSLRKQICTLEFEIKDKDYLIAQLSSDYGDGPENLMTFEENVRALVKIYTEHEKDILHAARRSTDEGIPFIVHSIIPKSYYRQIPIEWQNYLKKAERSQKNSYGTIEVKVNGEKLSDEQIRGMCSAASLFAVVQNTLYREENVIITYGTNHLTEQEAKATVQLIAKAVGCKEKDVVASHRKGFPNTSIEKHIDWSLVHQD